MSFSKRTRRQKSGVRSQNSLRIPMKQTAGLFEGIHQVFGLAVSQILRQNQVIPAFLNRSLGHIHESDLVRSSSPTEPFRNISCDGDRRPSHLAAKAIRLLPRKALRECVDREHVAVSLSPYNQISECLGGAALRF